MSQYNDSSHDPLPVCLYVSMLLFLYTSVSHKHLKMCNIAPVLISQVNFYKPHFPQIILNIGVATPNH